MKNNKLVVYKDNIFTKVLNFFKNLFPKDNIPNSENEGIIEEPIKENQNKEKFISEIRIKQDKEELRLKQLKLQYDNDEINEEDIPDEDINKLIEMYENETNKLNEDTEKIKNHIIHMLKELKSA